MLKITKEQNNPKFRINKQFVLSTKHKIKQANKGSKIIENNINLNNNSRNKQKGKTRTYKPQFPKLMQKPLCCFLKS